MRFGSWADEMSHSWTPHSVDATTYLFQTRSPPAGGLRAKNERPSVKDCQVQGGFGLDKQSSPAGPLPSLFDLAAQHDTKHGTIDMHTVS